MSLQNLRSKSIHFLPGNASQPVARIETDIDMRGCVYDLIHPASFWKEVTDKLEPYDRQPYQYFEEKLRQSGQDEHASDVYYARKRKESARITAGSVGWVVDRFLWLFTGYGTRLNRLMYLILPIIMAGILLFGIVDGSLEETPNDRITTDSPAPQS